MLFPASCGMASVNSILLHFLSLSPSASTTGPQRKTLSIGQLSPPWVCYLWLFPCPVLRQRSQDATRLSPPLPAELEKRSGGDELACGKVIVARFPGSCFASYDLGKQCRLQWSELVAHIITLLSVFKHTVGESWFLCKLGLNKDFVARCFSAPFLLATFKIAPKSWIMPNF